MSVVVDGGTKISSDTIRVLNSRCLPHDSYPMSWSSGVLLRMEILCRRAKVHGKDVVVGAIGSTI